MNKKVKIGVPSSHYKFFRVLYSYLNDTLPQVYNEESNGFSDFTLSSQLLGHYIKNEKESLQAKKVEIKPTSSSTSSSVPNPKIISNGLTPTHPTQGNLSSKYRASHESSFLGLAERVYTCQNCFLGKRGASVEKRSHRVKIPNLKPADFMVVNDIPSYYDKIQGEYFKDEVGKLFIKILSALNLKPNEFYFTSAIKCASAVEIANQLDKVAVCQDYLKEEISLVKPKLILGFGPVTYEYLFGKRDFKQVRGKLISYQGVDAIFTHHPRELIENTQLKKECWQDLKPYVKTEKG